MNILKRILPDIIISKITDLDYHKLNELKKKYGIEGLILDVDETLRYNMNPISPINKKWLEQTIKMLKIVVVSNGFDHTIKEVLDLYEIEYISVAFKPLKKSFIKAKRILDIPSQKIMVVGDSYFDDILGGKLNNMVTALIKNW